MQNQAHVEHALGQASGNLPFQHVQEVRGVAELAARLDGVVSTPNSMPGSHDGRQLGDQADDAQPQELGVRNVVALVEHTHGRDGGGERIHRLAAFWQGLQKVDDSELETTLRDQLVAELVELGRARQVPENQ